MAKRLLIATILVLSFVGPASARTWYVDDDGGADFTGIQEAISAASAGDTIIVKDGTYIENVDVDKRLTIRSENGGYSTIVPTKNSDDHVFELIADNVTLSGFIIEEASDCGIFIAGVKNCNISNNIVSGNSQSILLWTSSENIIANNTAKNNWENGIWFDDSNNNTILNNTCSNNTVGIVLADSSYNIIYHNNFINNVDNVVSYNSTNIWNSTEKITYTYNGSTYTNYLGNYWSDYKEKYPDAKETDSTGIWDTPYILKRDKDNYPLTRSIYAFTGCDNSLNLIFNSFSKSVQFVAVSELFISQKIESFICRQHLRSKA